MRKAPRSSTVHSRAIVAAAVVLGLTLVVAASAWAALAVSIETGPGDPTSDRTPTFTFTHDAGATTVECSIDQEAPVAGCESPYTVADPLADGAHTFRVRVSDGNEEQTAEYAFSVDATPPALSIGAGQEGPTNVTTPELAFTVGGDAATVECWVDQETPVAGCESPYRVGSSLSDGRHTFNVRARDALGNVSNDDLVFTVDATPPALSIGAGQEGPTNVTTPEFAFTVDGSARTVECWVDQESPVAGCESPYRVGSSLSDGRHTFNVRARDALGNVSNDDLVFTVDTVRPTASVTSWSEITNSRAPSFGFTVTGERTIACSIDRGTPAWVECASPYTPARPLVADGRYTFRVLATDSAGNQAGDRRDFTVDSAAPSLAIGPDPADPTNDTTPSFSFTAEAGSRAACAIDQETLATCTSPYTRATPLPEGSSTFRVKVTDDAGNTAEAFRSITIDTTPPSLSIGFGPDGPTSDSTPLFQFTAEAGATVACSIDQGVEAFGPCASTTTHAAVAPLADGAYVFRVRATDRAGNQRTAVRAFTVGTGPTPGPETPRPVPTPPSGPRLLSPFPLVRISGTLTATGARIRLLSVRAPQGASVRVTVSPACGRGRRSSRRCRVRRAAATVGRSGVVGFRALARAYRSGTVIVVRVWGTDRIGKYTRFTIVRGKAPRRVDTCLVPAATRGSRCPSG